MHDSFKIIFLYPWVQPRLKGPLTDKYWFCITALDTLQTLWNTLYHNHKLLVGPDPPYSPRLLQHLRMTTLHTIMLPGALNHWLDLSCRVWRMGLSHRYTMIAHYWFTCFTEPNMCVFVDVIFIFFASQRCTLKLCPWISWDRKSCHVVMIDCFITRPSMPARNQLTDANTASPSRLPRQAPVQRHPAFINFPSHFSQFFNKPYSIIFPLPIFFFLIST